MTDEDFFGPDVKEWKWTNFESTKKFPLSKELLSWVIGQDKPLEEAKLCIDEWINKLKWLKSIEWWKPFETVEKEKGHYLNIFGHKIKIWGGKKERIFNPKLEQVRASKVLPTKYNLPSGPFLLLLGNAGTGKSLIGRAMADYMTKVYQKNDISLFDIVSWENKTMPSEPRISIHPTPKGKKTVISENIKERRKGILSKKLFKILQGFMVGLGTTLLSIFVYFLIYAIWGPDGIWGHLMEYGGNLLF